MLKGKRFQLRILSVFLVLLSIFLSLFLATAVTIISYTYYETSRAFLNSADQQIEAINRQAITASLKVLDEAMKHAKSMAWAISETHSAFLKDQQTVAQMLGVLSAVEEIEGYYVGDEYGSVLTVLRLQPNQKLLNEPVPVPSEAVYMVRKINRQAKPLTETRAYINTYGQVLFEENTALAKIQYDPRRRPWYMVAKEAFNPRWTDVYLFENNDIGLTAAVPCLNGKGGIHGVVGVDVNMTHVSTMLSRLKIGKRGIPFIVTEKGDIIGHPDVTKAARKVGDYFRFSNVHEIGQKPLSEAFQHHKKTGEGSFTIDIEGSPYICSFVPFAQEYGSGWIMGVVVPQDDFVGPLKRAKEASAIMSLAILLFAVLVLIFFSRRISEPIKTLTNEMLAIKNFEIGAPLTIKSSFEEITLMVESLNVMKQGLESFGRYVPRSLVRQLIAAGNHVECRGMRKKLTLMFSDIQGFTNLSEGMSSEHLMAHLSEYFENLSSTIIENHGTIDKYSGDTIKAFWGAPVDDDQHANHACFSVLKCLRTIDDLDHLWSVQGQPPMPKCFALNTAEVVVGNIGSSECMSYTVVGEGVNLASRINGLNQEYGTTVLVSHSVYRAAKDEFVFKPIDIVAIKGKSESVPVYELCGAHTGDFRCDHGILQSVALYEEAFECYRQQQWAKALKIYRALLKMFPEDKVALLLSARCLEFQKNPPSEGWDGRVSLADN